MVWNIFCSTIYGIILPIDQYFPRWLKHVKTTNQQKRFGATKICIGHSSQRDEDIYEDVGTLWGRVIACHWPCLPRSVWGIPPEKQVQCYPLKPRRNMFAKATSLFSFQIKAAALSKHAAYRYSCKNIETCLRSRTMDILNSIGVRSILRQTHKFLRGL